MQVSEQVWGGLYPLQNFQFRVGYAAFNTKAPFFTSRYLKFHVNTTDGTQANKCFLRMKICTTIMRKRIFFIWETALLQLPLVRFPYLFSLALPVSITNTTSGIVIPVSAMFVASTTFLTPFGGTSNAEL